MSDYRAVHCGFKALSVYILAQTASVRLMLLKMLTKCGSRGLTRFGPKVISHRPFPFVKQTPTLARRCCCVGMYFLMGLLLGVPIADSWGYRFVALQR